MKKIKLENEVWALEVLPECGGKLGSLVSKATGREWLWFNPHIPIRFPEYNASYIEQFDSGGWDEIFPSVSPCSVLRADGRVLEIPDHGDLVGLGCEWSRPDENSIELLTRGRCASYLFRRRQSLEGNQLRLMYTVENSGEEPLPFLWCAHPLFAVEPAMQVKLPEATPCHVRFCTDETRFATDSMLSWSDDLGRVPDPEAKDFEPFAIKAFSAAGSVSQVDLCSPNGSEVLSMAWNADDVPYLGMWINFGAWSGCGSAPYFNLALEPTTAPYDGLDEAIGDRTERVVAPGETLQWEMILTYRNSF